MTINDYIDACIHFNSDTQLWHELDPHKYYYAPDASADWWREDCDHSAPGFALEWAFHKNMPLSARTGGPVKQVLYIHEHAAQELLNQFWSLCSREWTRTLTMRNGMPCLRW